MHSMIRMRDKLSFLYNVLLKNTKIETDSKINTFSQMKRSNFMRDNYGILFLLSLLMALLVTSNAVENNFSSNRTRDGVCRDGIVTFELITGYVFTAPADTMAMLPGTLQLTDCLIQCLNNDTCQSVNYETGLCVMLGSSAHTRPESLTISQFPVFTIYAQKMCLKSKKGSCNSQWAFERVKGYELKRLDKKKYSVSSREECMKLCLDESTFACRSANYDSDSHQCALSDMDRHTINVNMDAPSKQYGPSSGSVDYIENNCIREPTKLCDFKRVNGEILKTVDSVYQDVRTFEECRERCLNGPYRCLSFDFGDPATSVCRTSHLDKNSLTHIEDPYLAIEGSATYELASCYNVTILCRAREMIARVKTSKIFNGKIYAKSKPNFCVNDVSNSLEFEIKMKYHDVDCDVKQANHGQFSNVIVIQHHDMIVTNQDLGLSIHCQYDLSNRSISNNVNLAVDGDVDATGSQSATVSSPNITMKITDRRGMNITSAQVGDPLSLRLEIAEKSSPYEIFVRELVAVDGIDASEILLIDSLGCPTDVFIMGAMSKVDNGQILEAPFDAFKFPTSETVQFRALVTPCLPSCEPVKCTSSGTDGTTREVYSYGRRKRRDVNKEQEQLLLTQSISVSDKFGFSRHQRKLEDSKYHDPNSHVIVATDSGDERFSEKMVGSCVNMVGVIAACSVFLFAQMALICAWACVWTRRNHKKVQNWPHTIQSHTIQPHTIHTDMNFVANPRNEFLYSLNKY